MEESHNAKCPASWATVAGMIRLGDVVHHFLAELTAEAEENARQRGPLRGRVTPPQRPWSRTLDSLEQERQAVDA